MSTVFLSHSSKDKEFANRLTKGLRKNGHTVWIDEAEIKVGDSLIEKIREGIDNVEFVVAIISKHSIKSEWVKKELDLASNREIGLKKIIVLPILIDDVELPGFLKGKKYADFIKQGKFRNSLNELLKSLGPSKSAKQQIDPSEIAILKKEIKKYKKILNFHEKDRTRRDSLLNPNRSEALVQAIKEENEKNPEYTFINNSYAFEVMNMPVTIGYAIHALRKAEMKGAHILEPMLSIENKWTEMKNLIEAYVDYVDSTDDEK